MRHAFIRIPLDEGSGELPLAAEVMEERPLGHPELADELVHRHAAVTVREDELLRGIENPPACVVAFLSHDPI